MKIIFQQDDILSVLIPVPEFLGQLEGTEIEKLTHIANRDLESGTLYEIVQDDQVPEDRSFRGAWEYVSGDNEQISMDLSISDQRKYNRITQEEYDASNN